MATFDAVRFNVPRLRFDPAIPSRVHAQSYQGLRLHGPYDSSRVRLTEKSLLFVFPKELRALSRQLASVLAKGQGTYPGFQQLFRVELDTQTMYDSLAFEANLSDRAGAAAAYREAISADWNTRPRAHDPELAIVLVPHTSSAGRSSSRTTRPRQRLPSSASRHRWLRPSWSRTRASSAGRSPTLHWPRSPSSVACPGRSKRPATTATS